jgi:anti-sigma factor RsiW
MEHNNAHDELTAAYALDALDADEVTAYEDHLAGCEICQANLAALSATAVQVAYAAPPVDPPPELRGRILDAARAERQNVVPLRPPSEWLRPSARTAVAALAAVAACLVVGLGIWNVSLSNQLEEAKGLRALPLEGASGSLIVGGEDRGMLVVSNLDDAPAGKTYEAWVIEDGTPAPAGTFAGGETVAVELEQPVRAGAVVAVTIEDSEVAQPTTDPIITSQPV